MSEEKALIQRVLDGDHEAFAGLVTIHEKQVYNLCLRMTGDPEDAMDLSQEAFLKAWRGLRFYKFESAFSTWLYRLTSNVCIDHLRRQKRRPSVSLTVGDEEEELDVPDTEPLPEEQVLQNETQSAVAAAMNQLEEEFRLILTLRVVEERSYEEIADILDLKVGTVKSRIARARIKLKKILLQNGNNFQQNPSNHTERGMRREL